MTSQVFITWNKQVGAAQIEVSGSERDEFILADGRRLYDFTSTSFQSSFGHSCEAIRMEIHEQLDEMPIASPKSTFALKDQVSKRLLRLLDLQSQSGSGKLFYTVSGSEAVENALKIARHWTGRTIVLARSRSYHGASLGAMSVSGDWRSSGHLNFSEGTVRIPEPVDDPNGVQFAEIVRFTGQERIAAVIVETISGVNGVVIPPQTWWDSITKTCCDAGILLICDEVLAGFGRTGPPFAYQHFGLRPDLVTMSKGITGGYIPFGAVWVSPAVAEKYDQEVLACGLTNYAHPLGLAALEGVLNLFEDEYFCQAKRELEATFAECLFELAKSPFVSTYRQKGLLAAVEFHDHAPEWQACIDAGLYLVTRERSIILAPPFISTPERLKQAFDALKQLIENRMVPSS